MRVGRVAALALGVVCLVVEPTYALIPPSNPGDSTNAGAEEIDASTESAGFLSDGAPADYREVCPGTHATAEPPIHLEVDPVTGVVAGSDWLGPVAADKRLFVVREYEGETYYAGLSVVWCTWSGEPDPPPADSPWNGHPRYLGAYWYPIRPEPRVLIPPMFQKVKKKIGKPVLSWPNMNTENQWLFVAVPMAYTLDPIGYVEAKASVKNELGEASAWIRATPTRVDVVADGDSSSCLVGDAMEDHGADEDPPCAIVFEHVGRDIPVTVTLTWTITSSVASPGLPETLTTTTDAVVDVSEIQALVES